MQDEIQSIVDELWQSGISTSFVFGRCGNIGIIWSVDVLTKDGQSFEHPYGTLSLRQAAEIARIECKIRGWCK